MSYKKAKGECHITQTKKNDYPEAAGTQPYNKSIETVARKKVSILDKRNHADTS